MGVGRVYGCWRDWVSGSVGLLLARLMGWWVGGSVRDPVGGLMGEWERVKGSGAGAGSQRVIFVVVRMSWRLRYSGGA